MRIWIVIEDEKMRELIAFFLEARFGIDYLAFSSVAEAIASLSKARKEDLESGLDSIICNFNRSIKDLMVETVRKGLNVHYFCVTTHPSSVGNFFEKQKQWLHMIIADDLIQGLESEICHLFKEFATPPDEKSFSKISPTLLLEANPVPGNIFVKLTDQKFVRVMRVGFSFEQEDLEYFCKKRNFEHLYLRKLDVYSFANLILKNRKLKANPNKKSESPDEILQAKQMRQEQLKERAEFLELEKAEAVVEVPQVEKPQPASVDSARAAIIQETARSILAKKAATQRHAQEMAFDPVAQAKKDEEIKQTALILKLEKDMSEELETLQDMGSRMGFTPEVQKLTKKNVLQTIQVIRKTPRLSNFLFQMRVEKEKYISSHSMLMAYIACALASQMEWKSDSTYQKLTLASFLHDSTLKNHELATIQSFKELDARQSEFTPEELRAYKNHPIDAAEMVRQFSEIPPDVDSIIIQHHEKPDGSGFPRALTHSRIGPLATVFIVAHEVISFMMEQEAAGQNSQEFNLEKFLEKNFRTYQYGSFKKLLAAIPKMKN